MPGHRHAKAAARSQLFAAGVLFGLMAVVARMVSIGPRPFTPGQLTTVRFAVGAGLTGALFRLRPGTFRPVNRRLLATRGLLGGLAVVLYFMALARIPAGEATLLNNTFPVIATAISFYTLRERPTFHLAVALLVTTAGVFLVLGGGAGGFGLGLGELLGVGSAILGAGAVTSIRALRPTDNAPTIFFAFCLGGLVVSWPFALSAWPTSGTAWLVAAAVGLLSFAAQLLMTQAYGALTVPEAAIWQGLTPVASYLWALALLGERLSHMGAFGVLLGIGGVAYATVLGQRPMLRARGALAASAPRAEPPVKAA